MRRLTAAATVALLAATLAVLGAAPAGATVSPRTCGTVKVEGKRYLIKSHRLTCGKAVPYAKTYLARHRAPRGWRCTDYRSSQTKFKFICRRSNRDFLAIRR